MCQPAIGESGGARAERTNQIGRIHALPGHDPRYDLNYRIAPTEAVTVSVMFVLHVLTFYPQLSVLDVVI